MQYSIEVRAAHYCIEVINYNAGCGTKHTAAYIVKSDVNNKYYFFLTIGMTDAEILAKSDAMRFDEKGYFATYDEAQQKALSVVNSEVNRASVLEVWADAANAILHTAIAIEATEQYEANEIADAFAELNLVPENANTELEYEALSAGRAFDNVEPAPVFSLHYEIPTNIYNLDELSNVIAYEEWRALGTIDVEINALKAKLIQLNDKRIGIVEECAHWRGKCERAIEIAEYEQDYEANEADADLRQSIWYATGQDIM